MALECHNYSARCAAVFNAIIRAILKPLPVQKIWEWLDGNVIIPLIVGSRYPGPLDTGVMPQWRGLLEKYADRRVHFFTLCKSARIGGTLFFGICLVIEKIIRWPGPIGWMDPTRKTASRVSRQEIQPYVKACPAAAALIIDDKKHWTTLEMILQNCTFSIVGAGSMNDLGGRQWELVIINEQDRIPNRIGDAPSPSEEAKARSSQFEDTRKIVRNSTPTREGCLTWGEFLAGSQENCYVPCPECFGYQRLTFFKEPGDPDKWMRVSADDPAVRKKSSRCEPYSATDSDKEFLTRDQKAGCPEAPQRSSACSHQENIHTEREGNDSSDSYRHGDIIVDADRPGTFLAKGIPPTGQIWWPPHLRKYAGAAPHKNAPWDVDAIAGEARYECAFCATKIRPEQLPWMNDRYAWRSHNPDAPRDHVSAHLSALYSPFQSWGAIAKEYLLGIGNALKLHAFWNLILGLPFISIPTKLTKKSIELIQQHSPIYDRQHPDDPDSALVLPVRPVVITIQADVQQTEFWYTIRAWGVDGSRHVLAMGSCNAFSELVDLTNRVWRYDHGEQLDPMSRWEEFTTFIGIMDSGYKAKRTGGVYSFVHEQGGRWHCSKGGAYRGLEKPINEALIDFNYQGSVVEIPLIHYNDFILQEHLTRFVLKERRPPLYALPRDLPEDFILQMTAPHLIKHRQPDGKTESRWNYNGIDPHQYDCEKLGEVLGFVLTPDVLAKIRAKQDADRAAMLQRIQPRIDTN